jgi:hypothetical protein
MAPVDRLRIGPWVPTYEPTAEHGLHRPRADATAADGPPDWRPPTAQDVDDDAGRRYRGYRRAARHRPLLVLIAALSVVAVVLLVSAALPRPHGMQPTAGNASPVPGPVLAGLPATYQADAPVNTLFGAAQTKVYPGASDGVIVRTLGNWGTDGEGALRFNDVVVPVTGTYGLTLYYVLPNNEPTRTVVITASGASSITLTVAGNATCCATQTVRVDLTKGRNSITFSNPAGHAPALDKIVISQF